MGKVFLCGVGVRAVMGFWVRWGEILLGAISIFSLTQRLFDLNVVPIFKDMLGFYHTVLHPIANMFVFIIRQILNLISIRLPNIPADIIIIYLILAAAFFRYSAYRWNLLKNLDDDTYSDFEERSIVLVALYAVIWPIAFIIALFFSAQRSYWSIVQQPLG